VSENGQITSGSRRPPAGRLPPERLMLTTLYALTGYMAKNAPHVGNASAITMQDGRKMFAGSSIAN